ncbi:hypothetical protein [Devosia sp.]|uniref:DUF7947 five-stranded beta-barrel domain-containing protein n=1 Tax=Devosia sp. TaxID=1871048 RepID=UPI001B27A0C9|nr:hypothetical protein [Devosia sp.]MBO9590617.1 hypothetical protein [Devosia sp.]
MSHKIRVYIQPARQGSFVQDVVVFLSEPNNVFMTTVVGSYAVATVGQIANAFIANVLNEVVGHFKERTGSEERWLSRFPSGDTEALVDRIEPSMRRAHDVIDQGASMLSITKGQTPIVRLDSQTKAWVNTNIIDDEYRRRTVSISAFNANSGNGRAYLTDVGKTVPFSVTREPDRGTYETLASSLNRYTRGVNSIISINSKDVVSVDGRVKKLIIDGAHEPAD